MLVLAAVPVLFVLFYLVPGAVLVSNTAAKGRRLDNLTLAILLSLIFAPLTFTLLRRAFPGNDTLLLAGFVSFWALFAAGVRFFPEPVKARLPDFGAIPKADTFAWLVSALLAVIVVTLRLGIFQGIPSQIGDDNWHLTKLTSIATTGLPSLHARQPLFPVAYYDLDYIAPALWVRYTSGAVGVTLAWVVHIGVHTLVSSLFLTRLMYMFARSRMTRLFGILALHTATGLELIFLPWQLERHRELVELGRFSLLQMEAWTRDLGLLDGFMRILMPVNFYVWIPQHQLGLAILGLIFLLTAVSRNKGIWPMLAIALLVAALFQTSPFVFVGALPGLALWHLYKLRTEQGRRRQLFYLAIAGVVALVLVLPSVVDFSTKSSYLELGLRSFSFLEIPGLSWLKYPVTALTYLLLELGLPFVILLWLLLRPSMHAGPIRFWILTAASLLYPFMVQSRYTNDIAMRGVLPAQLALALIGCCVLTQLEARKRSIVAAVVIVQSVLSLSTVGAELYFRYTDSTPPVPPTTRWISANTPLNALVFYDATGNTEHEVNYSNRMSYIVGRRRWVDYILTPFPESAWSCLPEVDLYSEDSLCAIEALVPGAQPVYVKYAEAEPELGGPSFSLAHKSEDASIFSLACPAHNPPHFSEPPIWMTGPYPQYRELLAIVPRHHFVAASSKSLAAWLEQERIEQRIFQVSFERDWDAVDRQTEQDRQLRAIDELSSPVWLLLDYTVEAPWNEQILSHALNTYYVAQPTASAAQWLQCKQRTALALPTSADELSAVHHNMGFDEKLVVNVWRVGSGSYQPGDVIPMELAWNMLDDGQFKFFVHLLDLDWNLFAQIDLSADRDGTADSQLTRMGLYLPPDLPAGDYQIRLGVYRASDGQRLMLPTGEDSIHIPFSVTH